MHGRSLSYELRYHKGQTWAAIATVAVSAIAAHRHAQQEKKNSKDAKELAQRRERNQLKLAEQDRIIASKGAQASTALAPVQAGTAVPTNNKAFLLIAAIGLAVSIIALRR